MSTDGSYGIFYGYQHKVIHYFTIVIQCKLELNVDTIQQLVSTYCGARTKNVNRRYSSYIF